MNKYFLKYSIKKKIDEEKAKYILKYYEPKTHNKYLKKIRIKNALKKTKTKPLQYIVGNTNFYGYVYNINKKVLIPRFETELLVEETLKLSEYLEKPLKVLDIGTGSGCIGITIKKEKPESEVTLLDISNRALSVAKNNLKLHKLKDVKLIKSNVLKKLLKKQQKYNIVISNPPYLYNKKDIEKIVIKNEPKKALFAKDKGLYIYKKILENVESILEKEFIIAFETGDKQHKKIKQLIKTHMKNVKIITKRDYSGRERFIFIIKTSKLLTK